MIVRITTLMRRITNNKAELMPYPIKVWRCHHHHRRPPWSLGRLPLPRFGPPVLVGEGGWGRPHSSLYSATPSNVDDDWICTRSNAERSYKGGFIRVFWLLLFLLLGTYLLVLKSHEKESNKIKSSNPQHTKNTSFFILFFSSRIAF